ncbi:MAG: type II toxin-antitoxin system RelE/ParE family toxin [Bacteroidetes bacterium]|nr:type II toxin-antitoxin system RelE/ParE family toxin [Bacteroidota bacterium]
MTYKIKFKKSVYKDLSKVPSKEAKTILDKIDMLLAEKPTILPALKGKFKGMRRMRVGNYRVIYVIIEDVVLVLRIHHRKDVYK